MIMNRQQAGLGQWQAQSAKNKGYGSEGTEDTIEEKFYH